MQFTTKIAKLTTISALAALCLSGCSIPGITIFGDNQSGTPLAAGEASTAHFFTKEVNHDTGIHLDSGTEYEISVTILSNWIDGNIATNEDGKPLTEKGFDNSQMPYEFMGLTRRSRENNWFELMLEQPACSKQSRQGVSELNQNQETGSYSFTASCSGKLNLFVNDSFGFYGNNIGYANIALSRVN